MDICLLYDASHNILFYMSKTVNDAIGHKKSRDISSVCIDNQPIQRVNQFKYFGVTFDVSHNLNVDVLSIKY